MKTQKKQKKEFGGGLVEYGMLVGLIAIVALVSVKTFGDAMGSVENQDSIINFHRMAIRISGAGGLIR